MKALAMYRLTYRLLIILLIAGKVEAEILRLKCETYANFSVVQENKRLNHTFATFFGTDKPTCQYECSLDSRCKSINVKNDEDICELNNKSSDDPRDRISTVPVAGWTFYSPSYKERLVGINCRQQQPCGAEQKCIDTCYCPGYICQDHDAVYSSCVEALTLNENKQSTYRIQHHNMAHSATVECKIRNNETVSVLHHDIEQEVVVQGYDDPQSYRKSITYANSFEDIVAFVESSISCRQFTKISCYAMLIFTKNGNQYGALIDRNDIVMEYFGGGPVDGRGCQCGITKSCVDTRDLCNCDKNDRVWRIDEGYVTDKRRLPLKEVRLGDNGEHVEKGKHIIGPLECKENVNIE